MKQMNSKIVINSTKYGATTFPFCESFSSDSTWRQVGDYGTVVLPYIPAMWTNKPDRILRGDTIEVYLGYDNDLKLEFKGYVAKVNINEKLELQLEDGVFNLRKTEVKAKAWSSVTLKEVLQYAVPTATIDVYDIKLTDFRIEEDSTALRVVTSLLDYGLAAYYTAEGKLFIGVPYTQSLGTVKYHFQKNCQRGSLEYFDKDELKIKLKLISLKSDNTKVELEYGDADGEVHTLHFFNLTKADLQNIAQAELEKVKYSGLKGQFTAFGQPQVRHSQIVELTDERKPQYNGSYFVEKVSTRYNGKSGFRRIITPGKVA